MKRLIAGALSSAIVMMAGAAGAQDLKIALIYSKTGPLEAYAKQTENGLMLGLEYLTQGTLSLNGRKIIVLPKDDQGKPDVAKSLLEQAYADDKVDLAIGTTASGSALAMLPIAEDAKRVLIVEPAVADSITGARRKSSSRNMRRRTPRISPLRRSGCSTRSKISPAGKSSPSSGPVRIRWPKSRISSRSATASNWRRAATSCR